MKKPSLLFVALLAGSLSSSLALANKDAEARYESDKKLCAEEKSSGARMQCLRDAKEEYDKAKAASGGKAKAGAVACPECGKVVDVAVEEKKGEGGALGIIGGGVAGAIIGNQVGGGRGKDLATLAGAAGGAYAGHKIEERVKSTKVWAARVRFDNGSEQTFTFDKDPGFAVGDAVKAAGGGIVRH